MDSYKIFVDKLGYVFKSCDNIEDARELYEFALEQKKLGMPKFAKQSIYLMRGKDVIMSDVDSKKELGGEIIEYGLTVSLLNRYVNGVPSDKQIDDNGENKYDEKSFFVKQGKSFVEAVRKINGIFIILSDSISNSEKIQTIKACLEKQTVPFKYY